MARWITSRAHAAAGGANAAGASHADAGHAVACVDVKLATSCVAVVAATHRDALASGRSITSAGRDVLFTERTTDTGDSTTETTDEPEWSLRCLELEARHLDSGFPWRIPSVDSLRAATMATAETLLAWMP